MLQAASLLAKNACQASYSGCCAPQEGKFTVEGCLRTPVAPELVWAVLTDYDGLADVYSTILKSQSRLVDRQRQVLQAGPAHLCCLMAPAVAVLWQLFNAVNAYRQAA